jgi:hypothetical protein
MEPVVRAANGVKLVENNEPCLAVLANFLAPICASAISSHCREEFKESKLKGCDPGDLREYRTSPRWVTIPLRSS